MYIWYMYPSIGVNSLNKHRTGKKTHDKSRAHARKNLYLCSETWLAVIHLHHSIYKCAGKLSVCVCVRCITDGSFCSAARGIGCASNRNTEYALPFPSSQLNATCVHRCWWCCWCLLAAIVIVVDLLRTITHFYLSDVKGGTYKYANRS